MELIAEAVSSTTQLLKHITIGKRIIPHSHLGDE